MMNMLFILGQLTDQDMDWLALAGSHLELKEGARLIEYGHPIESVYVVLEGRFVVSRGGRRLGTIGSGEMIGEMSFIDASLPSADVVAERNAHVLALPRSVLQERLNDDPGFASRFYRAIAMMLSHRLRSQDAEHGSTPRPDGVLEPDELDPSVLDTISRAGDRFDALLKRLRVGP
jgi:CRP-like cAMP-binding protein